MTDRLTPNTARWLLAFFLLLILYGSLFPLELRAVHVDGPLEALRRMRWGIWTRGDVFVRVRLRALRRRDRRWVAG